MTRKKAAAPHDPSEQQPAKAAASRAQKPAVAPETAWLELEQQLRDTRGENAVGQYPVELEPRHVTFKHAPDLTALLPDAYQRFVEALGYRWVNTGRKGLGFLPPRWRVRESQAMGVPGRDWTAVREEREAGRHTYRFVMFASADLNDSNGYCFGKSGSDESLVVWLVEDSLPTREEGPFSEWLARMLAPLRKAASKSPQRVAAHSLGDPLALAQMSVAKSGE